jgi:hypothetical protein
MFKRKNQGSFEIRALIYTHRLLLLLFLGTLIVLGVVEAVRRIRQAVPGWANPTSQPLLDRVAPVEVSSQQK